MKKLLVGLLTLSSFTAFSSSTSLNGCKVNIVEEDGQSDRLIRVLEKHGFEIVNNSEEANLSVTSGLRNLTLTTCDRVQCIQKDITAATTNLHAISFNSTNLMILRAGSFMTKEDKTQVIAQGFEKKKFLQSSKKTILKSIADFDSELERAKISCQ